MPIVGWSPQIEQQHEPLTEFSLEEPYRQLTDLCPAGRPPRLILVEGLQLLQTSGKYNDPQDVAIFTAHLQEFCDRHDCVILGTVGMAKMKNNDTYTLLPHKIIGSGQWAVGTSCLMGFEKVRGLTCREITVMARDGHFPTLYADFDPQGRLMMVGKPEIPLADNTQTKLDQMLALDTNGEYSYADLVAWGSTLGVSLRTVDRWIRGKVAAGELEKVGSTRNVTYRKPIPN
jgi:hypothetical protein